MKWWLLTASLVLALALWFGIGDGRIAAQEPPPIPPPGFSLADDVMPPTGSAEGQQPPAAASDYKVTPILFVANDLTPNSFGLQFIDKKMQLIQRWYAEQLRGRTFDLAPAQVVIGTQPLSYYYGACYPPTASCDPSQIYLWPRIFDDLANLGYPVQSNRVLGVFFQQEGVGGLGLGLHNQFLVSLETYLVFEDCLDIGCIASLGAGVTAHEFGHTFGLVHPVDDPEGSPGKSLMGTGYLWFPQGTFVNTSTNPERDLLYASPFITTTSIITDGGFEDCLISWTVSAGAPLCTTTAHRSGLSALQIPGDSNLHQLSQEIAIHAGQTYDVSGWLKILSQTSSFSLQIQILTLNASDTVISTFDVGSYTSPTSDWERFGLSMTMPAGATKARLQITAQGLGALAYFDGFDFKPTQRPPLSPLPMFYSEGDVVPTQQPILRWSDVTGATSFRLQVTSDRAFNSLVADVTTPSPFYPLGNDLAYNRRYFWRVKAMNGAGQSAWSPAWSFIPRPADHYYNDEFETGSLSPVWSWVREAPGNWGFSGPPWGTRDDGYLYLDVLVGGLHSRHDAKNLLLQPLPAGDFEASTFFLTPGLGSNKRQAGLLIYQDDDNYFKLVYIYEDGYKIRLQGVVSQTVVAEVNIPRLEALPIKIARRGNTYSGYYSTDDVTWQSLGQPLTVTWPTARMGLVAFDPQHDPIDDNPNQQARMFFDWFRVRPGCTRVITDVYPLTSGTVTESAGDCNEGLGHSAGFIITLAANPNPGYQFLSWSGAITGTTNPISLTISHDITVTANFSQTLQNKRIFLPIIYHQ